MNGDVTDPTRGTRGPFPVIAIVVGALVAAAGLWFVGAYIFGAVIDRLGEPDQSLLFWYLPLVFIGIACLAAGGGAIAFGVSRYRRGSIRQAK